MSPQNTKATDIEASTFDKIEGLLKQKGNNNGIPYYWQTSKKLDTGIYEVLCEIERVISYDELAHVFSQCSGIPLSTDIKGDILHSSDRLIETTEGLYSWHYATLGSSRNGKDVFIIPKKIFDACTTVESIKIGEASLTSNREFFIQRILKPAMKINATDIHIVPKEMFETYKVYLRVLGDLKDIMTLSPQQGNAITRALLYWAKDFSPSIRIDDSRRPQDGKIEIAKEHSVTPLDMRLSFIPTPNMKYLDVVIRLLYKIELGNSTLHGLGFFPQHEKLLLDVSLKNQGIVLVSGGTGTGKSRTINTILSKISLTRNVLTVEDPVEYLLSNARQFQTFEWESSSAKKSIVDFGDFARAFKRHDPDVIFIGEIRDKVTAETAFHLSKTGHLVFATLHASRATMVPEMLVHDYERSIDEIADNLILATNQVLVKRICPLCSQKRVFADIPEWFSLLSYHNAEAVIGRLKGQEVRGRLLIGEILRNAGALTDKQLEEALKCQRTVHKGMRIGYVLDKMGFVKKENIERILASQKNTCQCTIKHENSVVSTGYTGRTVFAECIPFRPEMFEDGNISVMSMSKKTAEFGNILDDAVEKILKRMVDVDALGRLI